MGVAQALLTKITRSRLASGCARVMSPLSSPVLSGFYTTIRNIRPLPLLWNGYSQLLFFCLVQDASALLVCRAFVATATFHPGVNPLELDVPPKARCCISTAVPI